MFAKTLITLQAPMELELLHEVVTNELLSKTPIHPEQIESRVECIIEHLLVFNLREIVNIDESEEFKTKDLIERVYEYLNLHYPKYHVYSYSRGELCIM